MKGGRKRGREVSIGHVTCPQPGTWLATQARALTQNGNGNPLIPGMIPNPPSHTSQGPFFSSYTYFYSIFTVHFLGLDMFPCLDTQKLAIVLQLLLVFTRVTCYTGL